TFIKDPREAVKTGDMVKVKVLEVDVERKRISLTMKTAVDAVASGPARNNQNQVKKPQQQAPSQGTLLANAFAKALKK
ncbi:MAG: S1 RNA-binding domain-containing protein, partial [Methylobacter sp.]